MELIHIQQIAIGRGTVNSVNARDLHAQLEIKKDFSDWFKQQVERLNLVENKNFIVVPLKGENPSGGRPSINYIVDIDTAKNICLISFTQKGQEVRDYFIECEKQIHVPQFQIPQTYKEALLALIEKEEELERAIATKAEIGTRREATAMNTASQAVKKANELQIELDRSKEYCTIKRMTMITHGQTFSFKLLRDASNEMNIPSIDIYDANYGTVKAYHKDVWLEVYGLEF